MAGNKLDKIRTGAISRGFALARVTASAGARATGHVLGNLFSAEETRAERLKALLLDQVGLLTRELGELKGSLMKVGQLLSMYGEQLFPPEVNAVLKSLQSQAPPLDWKGIEPVLVRTLGPEKLAELDIDHEPLASASLGQVHRAVIRATGEELALKIQFPGVDKAIDSDLHALRRILGVSKLLPGRSAEAVEELFAEVRQMLHHEVDFERERESTDRFRELLADDPRYVVARTYARYSGRRVLATELIRGVAVDGPEVRALSPERRNAIGAAALELLFREIFALGEVQTDPHFGNYRILLGEKQDRLALFDFGAVRRFPDRFLRPYRRLCLEALRGNVDGVAAAATELGFLREDDPREHLELFAEVCRLFLEPFEPAGSARVPGGLLDAGGVYDWGASDLPRRLARVGSQLALALKLRPPPREVIFLDRKMGGIFIFLASLDVRLNRRAQLEEYLTSSLKI